MRTIVGWINRRDGSTRVLLSDRTWVDYSAGPGWLQAAGITLALCYLVPSLN